MGRRGEIGQRQGLAGQPGVVVGKMADIGEMFAQPLRGLPHPAHVGSAAAVLARQVSGGSRSR